MGWKWEDFSSSDQQKMEVQIHQDLITEDLIGVSSYLTGFLKLDYPLFNNALMKDLFFSALATSKVQCSQNRVVASIVEFLGKMKVEWVELPQKTQEWFYSGIECCYSVYNPREIVNLIYRYLLLSLVYMLFYFESYVF
jgi:hypothetical protein